VTTSTITQPGTRAAETAAGLENAAAFIKSHPDLPLGGSDALNVYVSGSGSTDAEARAEIDRIAGILGVTPRENTKGNHYSAERSFGPGVTYKATAIDREAMDRYNAHMSPYYAAERAVAGKNGAAA
jgi:hypothetical protein